MSIKLIAMDLDGTLLNSQKVITPRTFAALQAAKERGIYVTIATGRMYMAAAYFGKMIGAQVPVICCNGGLVRGDSTQPPIFVKCYEEAVAREVLTECYKNDWYAQWYIDTQIYAKDFRPDMFGSYRTVEGFNLNAVGEDFLPYTKDVIQIVIRDKDGGVAAITEKIRAEFSGLLDSQQNTDISVDLTPPGINKAVGLKALLDHLNLSPDEVMACGDGDNDLAMLEYAGFSVATGNALSQAKQAADVVTDTCDQDGIGKAIERYVLQNRNF